MSRPSRRRSTILLLVALSLVGTGRPATEAAGTESGWWQSWNLAAWFWESLFELWGEEGCSADPNGTCGSGSQVEHGCSADPNGRCVGGSATAEGSQGNHGCSVDPNGRCASEAITGDNGCSLDPNGTCGH